MGRPMVKDHRKAKQVQWTNVYLDALVRDLLHNRVNTHDLIARKCEKRQAFVVGCRALQEWEKKSVFTQMKNFR